MKKLLRAEWCLKFIGIPLLLLVKCDIYFAVISSITVQLEIGYYKDTASLIKYNKNFVPGCRPVMGSPPPLHIYHALQGIQLHLGEFQENCSPCYSECLQINPDVLNNL